MNGMRQVGNSELYLPSVGLGCGPIGGASNQMDDAIANAVLETAWDCGIRHFDTAPWYGNTQSEHRLGSFLRRKKSQDHIVTTKVGRCYRHPNPDEDFEVSVWRKRWPGGLNFIPRFDFSRSGILRSYEDSLARLGIPRVDGLAIHDLDSRHQKTDDGIHAGFEQLEKQGGFQALADLKSSGEIKAIGAGINFVGLIPEFLKRFPIDYFVLAMPYTLLNQEALEEDLPMCEEHGASVVVGAPFASGILASGPVKNAQYAYQTADREMIARVKEFQRIGHKHGVELTTAALQFPTRHPAVVSVIPGADDPVHVKGNLDAFDQRIPDHYWDELKQTGLIDERSPV